MIFLHKKSYNKHHINKKKTSSFCEQTTRFIRGLVYEIYIKYKAFQTQNKAVHYTNNFWSFIAHVYTYNITCSILRGFQAEKSYNMKYRCFVSYNIYSNMELQISKLVKDLTRIFVNDVWKFYDSFIGSYQF